VEKMPGAFGTLQGTSSETRILLLVKVPAIREADIFFVCSLQQVKYKKFGSFILIETNVFFKWTVFFST